MGIDPAGREWDRENTLYYYRARCYDPQIGRFLKAVKIVFAELRSHD